jgi:putative endonuclease
MAGLDPAIPIMRHCVFPQTIWTEREAVLCLHPREPTGRALYVGVTSDLVRRIYEHRHKLIPGHTKRFHIDRLVYFEVFDSALAAIQREKNLKHWPRAWKTDLIGQTNATWRDLYPDIVGP